jgi:cell division protein FtsW (lipid II flippase)
MRTPSKGRGLERLFLLLAGIVLGLLFFQLFSVLRRDFEEVPSRIADGTMVHLNTAKPDQRVADLLQKGFYFEDPRDIQYVRSVLASRQDDMAGMDNIGELNKRAFNVVADEAYARGGESFRKRVKLSRGLLGFSGPDSSRFEQERSAPPPLSSSTPVGAGNGTISGRLVNEDGQGVGGVLVRAELILPQDSVYSPEVGEIASEQTQSSAALRRTFVLDSARNRQLQSLSAYARTDADGEFSFTGLPEGKTYEVLPLQPGYQYGSPKGIMELDGEEEFTFRQSPHTIRLFSTRDFNNLKKEKALIVRTPEEAMRWYGIIIAVFFLSFLVIHIFLSAKFPAADSIILPVVMLLTGISLITLLSLQDPLRDRFLARTTMYSFLGGIAGLLLLLLFNMRRFTPDSGLFRLFLKNERKIHQGWQWAGAAILLLLLTILFGSGPEGSGVKVNLAGFQPSELVKILIIFFLAGFFTANEKFIAEYVTWNKRWSFFSFALASIVMTILLFLLLGDLGPAMVCCFMFIILFSFSRGDFVYAIAAVVLYVLAVWVIRNVWIATAVTALGVAAMSLLIRRQVSESAVMALVVMAGFLLLDQVPFLDQLFPGPVQRLVDRKAIWENAWDNEVFGGDHVANGIWAMASGGVQGQGVGEGFAKTIPEAHTDMILPSFGEEFGWMGIVCVFILFLIYLHRSIIIGRQTGTPFLFYLCAGIGIGTFVQFLLIAGGSTGALPLSGVSLPFVSYGGSSLVINLIAAGFLLSASNVQGTPAQMKFITRQQDRNLMPALIAACIGILLLSVNVGRYLFNNKKWVVQPALVADRSGARMFSYNPRINILMNRLQAGTLFDRKGLILATSKPEMVTATLDTLSRSARLDPYRLRSLARKRLDRYYPFGEHMFFWTGDANTGIFNGGNNGYFAEYELGAELRGFPSPLVHYDVHASRYREDRYLPQTEREMSVARRDFSALAPLLLAGINSSEVEAFKKINRDVHLSVDAGLQTAIQQSIQNDVSLQASRVSVVIMEDSTGDVLASAAYPLPPVNDWETMNLSRSEQNRLPYWLTSSDLGFTHATQPGSTAKLATTLAAFNKMGMRATQRTFLIRQQDVIRTRSDEPDETGTISLERALVRSNNPYFIRIANEEALQEEMATLYLKTGMFLRGVGGYHYESDPSNTARQDQWRQYWRSTEFRSRQSYNPADIRKTRGRGISGMAWGQGELIATPAAMARLAAGIANNGFLVQNRFVLKISDSLQAVKDSIVLAKDPQYAKVVTGYMKKQSAGKVGTLGMAVAGKTGTPERFWKKKRINDGWYVFFAPKADGRGHVVVCVRIESTKGSSIAVKLAGTHVIPVLLQRGYIKGFGATEVVSDEE